MEILYLDKRIVVCVKPAGVLSTDEPGGMPSLVRQELGDEHACVRTIHRLDRPVGGVMVLARSAKAASELSRQVREGILKKEYLAVVHGVPEPARGRMEDLLYRDRARRMTFVTETPGPEARLAVLEYETLASIDGMSLVSVKLLTGRTHQIRCQFASRSLPLTGDRKYGLQTDKCDLALWSHKLSFIHPETDEPMTFMQRMPEIYPFTLFSAQNIDE